MLEVLSAAQPATVSTAVLRRLLAACAFACAAFGFALPAAHAASFGFDDVAREAQRLSRSAWQAPAAADPRLAAMTYDDYRRVRFKPEKALWRDAALPFEAEFFPLGRGFTHPLRMHEIVDGAARPLRLDQSLFDGDGVWPPMEGGVAGVAGWRLLYPLNADGRRDEVIAFLGASYFRALGAGQRYGLSARGLAVDTTGGRPEEFPAFTAFWLERPAKGAKSMSLLALLDGPSVTGAYRFTVQPGRTSVVDVQARLYLRKPVAMLGIAPLTSMFLMGENQPLPGDFRPEVHDSDGLQVHTGDGEWIWRPLTNPKRPFVTSFAMQQARGFGLMQRDRAFASYEDLEAHYERRPSVWVEPIGDWGPGRVELLQFGTPDETHDNIVATWVPDRLPPPGQPLTLAWRLHWAGDDAPAPPRARVVQTRAGHGWRAAGVTPATQRLHLDFAGPSLQGLPPDAPVEAVADGNDNVRALRALAYPNPVTGGWRVTLDFERPDPARPVELRAFLRLDGRALSETWSYALAPE